ncbi:unnamed protein product [Hymenolepis diminuta]|uniref:Uncharacterized protein n=1 Tax=Hymenolepis diminuta TaxID=6216 RepID=A0A564Z9B2_HYMDI|nr:unnamed protein product [Hymenolepis diminuta]
MERRTDFEVKATEPAEVVDAVGDDCEEVCCEESGGDAEFGGFGAGAEVDEVDASVIVFELTFVLLSEKTATTNRLHEKFQISASHDTINNVEETFTVHQFISLCKLDIY